MKKEKKEKTNPHARALGQKGGRARAKKLTAHERSVAARSAAKSRWL